ncbi:MAG: hypothetical protein BAJALOKI3v1_150025 [Promethearchaeota archaeon]|jgi:uncharacterized protein (DUF4213/DUF364 family)|nr:MAG: hypothetical protein BAJALOKI3v1_150025 [Candidatus Lokiarchaeota archaeon]
MSINKVFVDIIKKIEKRIRFDKIKNAFFPSNDEIDQDIRFDNFGVIQLADESIGIVYIALSEEVREKAAQFDVNDIIGKNPIEIAKNFIKSDLFQRCLALGAINAITQSFFKKANFEYDFSTNSLGLLDLVEYDKVGMVGYFPPLVKKIEKLNIPLVVIEKKKLEIETKENWQITSDPSELKSCTKILCTSTTVLNDSIDDILSYIKNANKISMVGPTGGFIPDPVFQRGVDVLGGTYIENPKLFMKLIRQNKKWGPSTKKYCIQAKNYPNYKMLMENIS